MTKVRAASLTIAASVLSLASACGDTHVVPSGDAGPIIVDFDSAIRIDAGPPPPTLGAACETDADCVRDSDTCLLDDSFLPGGHCSRACDPADEAACGEGATCFEIDAENAFCFLACDPVATERTCERAGYGCADSAELPPICVGGCSDATDCAAGFECDPGGGGVGAGVCFDPDAEIGDPCVGEGTCPNGYFCITEQDQGWPSGTCVGFGCQVSANTGCVEGTACIPTVGGGDDGACIAACETDEDCRDAYRCLPVNEYPDRSVCRPGCNVDEDGTSDDCGDDRVCNPGAGTCGPAFDPSQLGERCSFYQGTGCVGGTCLSEFDSGYPGASCVYVGCTLGDDSTCPEGGVCAPNSSGTNLCLADCEGGCRLGYECLPSDPADPDSHLACRPACTSNTHCVNDESACNSGTGFCRPPLDYDLIGESCWVRDDCPGGTCLYEREGWPGGTCAMPGCQLTGTGRGFACPATTVCVDDEAGDPTIGHCLDACEVGGAATCRTDYECVAVGATGTAGACRPAS